MDKGVLTIISGFSGSGKGTILNEMLKRYDNYSLSVSATTRKPRVGEVEGKSYFFKSKKEFEDMIEKDELIEYAKYVDNYYGTPKAYVMEKLAEGKDVILEIEIQGALKVKEEYPDAMLVFISTPSALCLKKRLEERATESSEQVEARLKRAVEEADSMDSYDYIIINDDLDTAVKDMHALIRSAKHKTVHNKKLIEAIKSDLKKEFAKEKN